MAGRGNKVGLDYFELDCHMEEKVRLIQAEFGLKGFAVIVKLYQKIYSEFGYYCEWNDDSLLLFMSENGVPSDSKNLIKEIISACIRRDIFSEKLYKKYGILTSSGVQKRYLKATAKREAIELKKEYLLISVPVNIKNVVINSISGAINSISGDRNKQSRVEKSRVEKSRVEKSRVDICMEPEEPESMPPVISLTLNDKTLHDIFQSDIDAWAELYPAVDIMQELRKMKGWIDANPEKRKTRRGISRFINNWLARTQDGGGIRRKTYAKQNSDRQAQINAVLNSIREDMENE